LEKREEERGRKVVSRQTARSYVEDRGKVFLLYVREEKTRTERVA